MQRIKRRLLIVLIPILLVFPLRVSSSPNRWLAAKTLDRDADPVIVAGTSLPGFAGAPLDQLFVYAYRESQWQQIPWQFDEVKDGAFVAVGNGLLDAADELVVMGQDCGDQAAPTSWIGDAGASANPRYEITVTDPLNTAKLAWIYIYRSNSLTETVTQDYVTFDYATSIFTTPVYKLGFFLNYLGGNRLELNGSGINVLDRSKFRFKAPDQDPFDEETFGFDDPQPKVLDGRVRAIAGYQELSQGILTIAYRSQFYDRITIDMSWSPKNLEWASASADFNTNMIGGTYYDANTPAGVTVDGSPDTVVTTPASLWQQISASTGTVLHAADVSAMQGTVTSLYKDNATVDPTDTGDQKSYGEMGVTVTDPIKYIGLIVTHYILPANQPNVGARYYGYFTHPLQAQASLQPGPSTLKKLFLPLVLRQ